MPTDEDELLVPVFQSVEIRLLSMVDTLKIHYIIWTSSMDQLPLRLINAQPEYDGRSGLNRAYLNRLNMVWGDWLAIDRDCTPNCC